jgi:hypothetical protein
MMVAGLGVGAPVRADTGWLTGVRGGFSHDEAGGEDFQQLEVFAEYSLPWQWGERGGWRLATALDGSVGVLHGGGKNGLLAALGPALQFGYGELPWRLDVGVSPTLLSRSHFQEADLGGTIQFTSHLGLRWQLSRELGVGYRFQHLSNAGLQTPNPGLEMHLFQLDYHF